MKVTGGQYILRYLEAQQVPYMLGIPGHGVLGLFDALRESDQAKKVKYLQVKHEQSAVHIADGYYRVSGKPLATLSSIGPGSLNTIIGLATAYVDSSAVLSFCGDVHTNMRGTGVLQEIERYQDSAFLRSIEPVTKRAWRAENVGQLPRILERSFCQMTGGRHGPIAIALPMDVQAETFEADIPAGAICPVEYRAPAEERAIARAVEIMKNARRPVILAGGGALKAHAAEDLIALAERWGAAVVTTLAGKSAFPENHPLYCFHTGSKGTPVGLELCRSADVILALGVRFADETTCSYRADTAFSFPRTRLIHVDLQAEEIGKNYPADLGIVADLKAVARQLCEAYPQKEERPEYHREIAQRKKAWDELLAQKRHAPTESCTISQLLGEMNRVLPENTIIATSSGNTQAQLLQEYRFSKPYTCLTTGGFSTMGWAMPAAAGAKLAKPDTPIVALMGDGDFMMTMQELATLVQYDIPVVVIVANNSGWFAIKDLQHDAYGEAYMFGNDWMKGESLYSPDFAEVARSFQMASTRIHRKEDVAPALEKALAWGHPYLIQVDVCRDYPYTGGESFGWWDVPVPGYISKRREAFEKGKQDEFRRR